MESNRIESSRFEARTRIAFSVFSTGRVRIAVPEAPARPNVTRVESSPVDAGAALLVVWSRPSDAGAPIASYALERRRADETRWTRVAAELTSTALECTCAGLEFGRDYQFRIAAQNQAGVGAFSEASAPVKCGVLNKLYEKYEY